RARTLRQAHHAHAARDRAAGDDDQLLALTVLRGEQVADPREDVDARLSVAGGDDARAELDHDAPHWWSLFARRPGSGALPAAATPYARPSRRGPALNRGPAR